MLCEPNTWSETEFGGNLENKYRKDDIINCYKNQPILRKIRILYLVQLIN